MNRKRKNSIKQIKSQKDYTAVLKTIDSLMDAKNGSDEENMLKKLSLLVEKYEEIHSPIPSREIK